METNFNTDGLKNGIMPTSEHVRAFVEGLVNGTVVYPRFKPEEAKASQGAEHERLWSYVLSLESAKNIGGGGSAFPRSAGAADTPNRVARRSFGWLGESYAASPLDDTRSYGRFLDRGVESSVFLRRDGAVIKARHVVFLDENGLLGKLAELVYHNYLFPDDAYALEQLARHDHDGASDFYLILRQPLVTPKTTADGYIIAPSEAQIRAALCASMGRYSTLGTLEEESSGDLDSEEAAVAKLTAFNGDYAVYDFQPGRNTFLDAKTGKVRFIDPRVSLNDPDAGFVYSKAGARKVYAGGIRWLAGQTPFRPGSPAGL